MVDRMKVKVIKKGAVKPQKASVLDQAKHKKEAAREMVSTVTNWVADFKQQKRQQTQMAIEQLFGQRTQPTES